LDSILPYLQNDAINEIDFTYLLSILSKPSTITNANKTDLNHLCSRVNNYLKSNNTRYRWLGSKLVIVINLHSELLMSNHTLTSMNALIKILETKCFIQDESKPIYQSILTLESCCDSLEFLIEKIKGKPTLTRELLTPKLPGIINALLMNIQIIPSKVVSLLYKLLLNNSTTFRPFGSKFEKSLMVLLNDDLNFNKFEIDLQNKILKSLVLVSFNLTRFNPLDIWRNKLNDLILEIKSVLSIYSEFLNLNDDVDLISNLTTLPKLPDDLTNFKTIFKPLSIDIDENSLDLLKINKRLQILINLLIEYLKTYTISNIKCPIGYIIKIGEILCAFNIKFISIKREIRDLSIKNTIKYSLLELNYIGLNLLNSLPELFGGDLLPHFNSILSSLDTLIPIKRINGKITVDDESIYENEKLIILNLKTCSNYLSLVELFNDMSLINKIIDSALILTKSRLPKTIDQPLTNNTTSSSSKHKKVSNTISFSDLLSHEHLFIINPSISKLNILRNFFKLIISKCQLTTSKLSEITRFIILDSVKNLNLLNDGKLNDSNKLQIDLLTTLLLFPGYNLETSISIIPMIENLIGLNSELVSILTNPRFPILQTRVKQQQFLENKEEYYEEENEPIVNESVTSTSIVNDKRNSEELAIESESLLKKRKLQEKQRVEEENENLIFKPVSNTTTSTTTTTIEQITVVENDKDKDIEMVDDVKIVTEEANANASANVSEVEVEEEGDDDIGSDFEIPEIDVGED
ncbi:hypothetical protein CANARDRAFT_183705, partial [[Candida] arabinofermentans NRRL YB-2248]